jgi:FdhD protein
MKRKIRTSGCAEGTAYGDMMERFADIRLDPDARFCASWLIPLSKAINTAPSLYLSAGAIHGCVLCEGARPLVYMEDIGRHNAVDKIAGWMFLNKVAPQNKVFYTTGRLTTEMVIKTVQMQIPVLVSRSGFTAAAVELAREAGLTLIGRAKGKRFIALAGEDRIDFDQSDGGSGDEFRDAPSLQRARQGEAGR